MYSEGRGRCTRCLPAGMKHCVRKVESSMGKNIGEINFRTGFSNKAANDARRVKHKWYATICGLLLMQRSSVRILKGLESAMSACITFGMLKICIFFCYCLSTVFVVSVHLAMIHHPFILPNFTLAPLSALKTRRQENE